MNVDSSSSSSTSQLTLNDGSASITNQSASAVQAEGVTAPRYEAGSENLSDTSLVPSETNTVEVLAGRRDNVELTPKDFEKVKLLGRGDTGKVYLVRKKNSKDGELYAMKTVDKASIIARKKVNRVMTELDFLKNADHPLIVKLYYSFQTEKRLYFIMSYAPGGELFKFLKSQPNSRLKEQDAVFYAAQVLVALEYVHFMGFVYRDLKPENILITTAGHIMLTDFDLSKAQGERGATMARSPRASMKELFVRNGSLCGFPWKKKKDIIDFPAFDTESHLQAVKRSKSFVGTVEYIAPEIITGDSCSGTVDWWTYGVLLYEMVVGTTPFKGVDQMDTFGRIVDGDLSFPEDVELSHELKNLISLLLAKDIKNRLQTPYAIKRHPFFKDVNFGLVRNMQPPFIPQLKSSTDTRHFFKYAEASLTNSDDEAEPSIPEQKEEKGAVAPQKKLPRMSLTVDTQMHENPFHGFIYSHKR